MNMANSIRKGRLSAPLNFTLGTTKTVTLHQAKLTQHRIAQPEKISQPWALPVALSSSLTTASVCATPHRGLSCRAARTRPRQAPRVAQAGVRALGTQRHNIAFCKHQRCATVYSMLGQPNPAVNRTACKLRLQVPSAFGSGSRLPLR